MTQLLQRARDLLQRLRGLSDATAVTSDNLVTAKAWSALIEGMLQTLERHDYNLVFVGKVGVGKSSLISVLTELFLGESPRDKAALQEASVLPLAAGRTTAFEIRLRESDEEPARIGLDLEPMDEEDMLRELRLFAEGEWRRRRDPPRRVVDDAATAIETDRILRGMTGYAEKYSVDPATKRRRLVRPLDDAVAPFATLNEFSDHVIARANLADRKQTTWTCADMDELKGLLARIHHGEELSASLPERVTLIVPRLLRELADGLRLIVVDTRGLDGQFESRADLQQILRDPRSIPVLCSSFADAPDENTRAVLRSAQADPSIAESLSRALLVLLDRDDAFQVDGANGDRGSGQDLKIDECNTTLHNTGLSAISRDQIVAFDLFQDDRGRLIQAIDERLTALRRAAAEKLEEHLSDAHNFLENHPNGPRKQLCAQVDRHLSGAATAQLLRGAPLRDPLQGALEAIRATRYASVVYASCRRNGAYLRLNVYAAIDAAAARAATEWLDSLKNALTRELELLKADPSFDLVNDHIRLREQQFTAAHAAAIRSYAAGVSAEAKRALEKDSVWWTCSAEWGDGAGFKERVLAHLEGWSRRQQSVTAHERTEFAEKIPFAELDRPPVVPRFTLGVRNLRALDGVDWTPSPVSLLVGANGVGKTTLLDVLRLLRRAYDAGLAVAVTEVFRGSNNLRHWSAREGETIKVGLTLGDYVWTVALVPRRRHRRAGHARTAHRSRSRGVRP
jgi:GTPase SAR1 family protein